MVRAGGSKIGGERSDACVTVGWKSSRKRFVHLHKTLYYSPPNTERSLRSVQQCFENLEAIVESIDHSLNDVARITVFVRDIRDMDVVDEVYRAFFTTYLPARTVMAVAALPMDALVQIDAIFGNAEGTPPIK